MRNKCIMQIDAFVLCVGVSAYGTRPYVALISVSIIPWCAREDKCVGGGKVRRAGRFYVFNY